MILTATQRLAELLAAHRYAAEQAKAATEHAKLASDALKTALLDAAMAADPGDPLTDTEVIIGEAKVTLRQHTQWRFDSTRCKAEYPEVYAAFAKQTSFLKLGVGLA